MMEDPKKIKNIIEALLIISENGLTCDEIKNAVDELDNKDIEKGIAQLKEEYTSGGRAFNISEIAGRYRIVTDPVYMPWITNLYERKSDRLTGPSLETLAIVAYKQPVTRAEVESIRGVNVGGLLKTLLDKGLIQIKGRKNAAGKPLIYGTTDRFLEIFGLSSLNELPVLKEISEEDLEFNRKNKMLVDNEETVNTGNAGEENPEVSGNGGDAENKKSQENEKKQETGIDGDPEDGVVSGNTDPASADINEAVKGESA